MVEIFRNIRVDWLGKRRLFFGITVFLILVGMISLVVKGKFLYGVDFRGGTIVDVRFQEKPQIDKIRESLGPAGANATIQELRGANAQNEVLIEFEAAAGAEANAGREIITEALKRTFGDKFEIRSAASVGPKVGSDLRRQAVLATLYALGGILVYIAFRFEWIYGTAAVFAVFHDTLVTLGLFSVFNREINLTVIAALLTLVGYSVNDTIVVFDRVRENLKLRRRDSLESIMNDSINQTLSRTILTSGLTFLTVLALFLFGGDIIRNFAFAMVIGIIVGTYSSIAIASPLVLIYSKLRGKVAVQPIAPVKPPVSAPVKGPVKPSAKAPRPAKAKS
jgi:preprotein translocase subunit SecF